MPPTTRRPTQLHHTKAPCGIPWGGQLPTPKRVQSACIVGVAHAWHMHTWVRSLCWPPRASDCHSARPKSPKSRRTKMVITPAHDRFNSSDFDMGFAQAPSTLLVTFCAPLPLARALRAKSPAQGAVGLCAPRPRQRQPLFLHACEGNWASGGRDLHGQAPPTNEPHPTTPSMVHQSMPFEFGGSS